MIPDKLISINNGTPLILRTNYPLMISANDPSIMRKMQIINFSSSINFNNNKNIGS